MGTPDARLAHGPVDEPLRVLVVEDDAHLRHGLLRAFPTTIAPLGVASLAEARVRLREEEWSAFVLDVGLPDGNGTELLQEIRRELGDVPVLVYTGWGDDRGRDAALAAGADYVEKPIDRRVVSRFVDQIAASRRFRSGQWPSPKVPRTAMLTPASIRRADVGRLLSPLLRVPDVLDTVLVVGEVAPFAIDRAEVLRLSRRASARDIEQLCGSARSIAALIADPIALADPDGAVALTRIERPETPLLVIDSPTMQPSEGDAHGIVFERALGDATEQQMLAFVRAALRRFDEDRRALDARALRWELTNRETELMWLCSMIVPRRRVGHLFGGGRENLKSYIKRLSAKIGTRAFHEIGRLARS